jgi:hypothetical protein
LVDAVLGIMLSSSARRLQTSSLACLRSSSSSAAAAETAAAFDVRWFVLRSAALRSYRQALRLSRRCSSSRQQQEIVALARAEIASSRHLQELSSAQYRLAAANQRLAQLETMLNMAL